MSKRHRPKRQLHRSVRAEILGSAKTEKNSPLTLKSDKKEEHDFDRKGAERFIRGLNDSLRSNLAGYSVDMLMNKLSENKVYYYFGGQEISRYDLNKVLMCKKEAPDLFFRSFEQEKNMSQTKDLKNEKKAQNLLEKAEKRNSTRNKQENKSNYRPKVERYNSTHSKEAYNRENSTIQYVTDSSMVYPDELVHGSKETKIEETASKPQKQKYIQSNRDAAVIKQYIMRYRNMTDEELRNELHGFIEKHDIYTIQLLEALSINELKKRILNGNSEIQGIYLTDLGLFLDCKCRGIGGKPRPIKKEKEAKEQNRQTTVDIRGRQPIAKKRDRQVTAEERNVKTVTEVRKPQVVPLEQGEGIAFEDFVVKGNNRRCIFNHESVLIKASISILNRYGKVIHKTIPAGFCPSCKSYYILKNDFDEISVYGLPLCQQFTEEEFRMYIRGWTQELKEHSIINQLGYNVNAKDDLSTTQRQTILALALDRHIYTRAQLDNHLYTQIALRVHNPSMESAIKKWEEDRKFIQNYKAGSIKIVGVKSITNKLINK